MRRCPGSRIPGKRRLHSPFGGVVSLAIAQRQAVRPAGNRGTSGLRCVCRNAIAWVKRAPNPMLGPSEIEIRPTFEAADFGAEFTPDLQEREERLRDRLKGR